MARPRKRARNVDSSLTFLSCSCTCASILPHVFDAFTQATRALSRSEGGLGIGLTLARRLVEQHGGSIEAHSGRIDQGSEFRVVLPLALPVAPSQRAMSASVGVPSGKKILIVDDNRDAAEMLAEMLTMCGNEVMNSFNGADAIALADKERPSVLFLDLGLPGLNGFAVAKELRQRYVPAELKIVAVTGYGQKEDIRQTRIAGFDDHLVKPAQMDEILKILSSNPLARTV